MTELNVALEHPVPTSLRAEVERRIFFVSESIRDFQVVEDSGRITGVRLTCDDLDVEDGVLADKLNRMLERELGGQTPVPAKYIWHSRSERMPVPGTFKSLETAGHVLALGDGQAVLSELVIRLMDGLDRALTSILRSHHDVREFRYPTLIDAKTLQRSGYFGSFPQHLMFVTRLHTDISAYQDFAARGPDVPLDQSVLVMCDNVDYCLPPTMCYHTFAQFSGHRFTSPSAVFTSRGKSFRYESRYARSLERLWDFTIREIVFVGDRDFVLSARQSFMAAAMDLVDHLDLSGHCEVANDSFFGGEDAPDRVLSQRLMELKYELRLGIDDGDTVAAGSFNYHDTHFTECFGIEAEGTESLRSGCVGFGLERFAYAFLCQHGLDPALWPAIPPAEPEAGTARPDSTCSD